MSLNQPQLQKDIKDIFTEQLTKTDNIEDSIETISVKLSTLIDAYLRSATITFPIGTIVVVGSAATQTNIVPTTGAIVS